jgi:hypothetical protein
MKVLQWYRAWRFDKDGQLIQNKALPQSSGQGQQMASKVLAPLQAQIAVYFGDPKGSLESLQDGVQQVYVGEAVICQSCNKSIWDDGHDQECDILVQYLRIFAEGSKW